MKLNTLMVINAILAVVFGLAFVLVPTATGTLYGVPPDPVSKYLAQLLGAVFIGVGVVTWMARKAAASDALRAIVLAYFISNSIAFIVALINQLAGVVNALGWSSVAIYLLLALGYAYFQFVKPSAS
jgi:hypothetical protein